MFVCSGVVWLTVILVGVLRVNSVVWCISLFIWYGILAAFAVLTCGRFGVV